MTTIEKPLKDKVIILMNCHNGEKYLYESLQSVKNQSYKNWELIFWDNKSTDASKKIFLSFKEKRFKYFYNKELTNLGYARYLASKHLEGDYLAIIDTDDVWLESKLELQVNILKNYKDIGLVYSNSYFFNETNHWPLYKRKQSSGYLYKKLLFNYNISLETILINFSYIRKLNFIFDKKFEFISDFDLVLRLSAISKFYYLNTITSKWRIHGNNLTFQNPLLFTIEKKIWFEESITKCTNKKKLIILKAALKKNNIDHLFALFVKNKKTPSHIEFSIFNIKKSIILFLILYIPFCKSIFINLIKK